MEKAKVVFKPVLEIKPVFEHVGEMSYPTMPSLFDVLFPPHMQRADFFDGLGPEISAQHLKFGSKIPTPLSQMHLYPISGAVGRVAADKTPWAYRDAKYAGVIVSVDPDPQNSDTIITWYKDCWTALHPFFSGGAYSNFMRDEGQDRVKARYRHNYPRLVEIKTRYDPQNLFRVNQNIKPKNSE